DAKELQGRLDAMEVPAVDADDFDAAANLLGAAETAVAAAEKALEDAHKDGKIEQSEIDVLEAAIENAKSELGKANDAIAALPEGDRKSVVEGDAIELHGRM